MLHGAKGAGKPLYDSWIIGCLPFPQERLPTFYRAFPGIGNIKVIRDPAPAALRIKDSNAFAAPPDPASKDPVPNGKRCNSRRIWPLGINQKLLVKPAFVIVAGRG